ncbi:zinc finger C2HC domain-containing protein 1C [Pseudophryne corroboree]|uniref:zinc finger C2HC domain-containing protein 1C n=1 Tax=Pseudophryne corroboree TaxID=495146 RepID=UPI003081EB40
MSQLKMGPFMYTDDLSDAKLLRREFPALKGLSRLELLRNEYQERAIREKEEKMVSLLTQQQERISQRVNGSSLHSTHPGLKQNPIHALNHPPQWAQEEKMWASNWTVSKRSVGVDRAHPLKPVVHRKAARNEPEVRKVLRAPSANFPGFKESLPAQKQVRSKSGPNQRDLWKQLENTESDLEAEIRKKETLLREKLWRTEEELRRIQKEREEAELEERRVRKIEDASRMKAERTQKRTGNNNYHHPSTNVGKEEEKDEDDSYQNKPYMKDLWDKPYGKVKSKPQPEVQYQQNRDSWESRLTPPHNGPLRQVVSLYGVPASGPANVPPLSIPTHKNESETRSLADDNPESLGERLVTCHLCERRFMEHRLEKHSQICKKMQCNKRKVFDSSKARAKGTDLEQYLQTKGKAPSPVPQVKGNSWRQKHESFMRTIQQARVVQNVIARGGKLSDLPPPPPEENPDYVPCPHCLRRFAPRAAERHIPKCETIKSRPRPPVSRRR